MVSMNASHAQRAALSGKDNEVGGFPVESFLNSLNSMKDALLPFELGIQRAAKELESCWLGPKNGTGNMWMLKVPIKEEPDASARNFSVKKNGHGAGVSCSSSVPSASIDDRKKSFTLKIPIKAWGTLFPNSGSNSKGEVAKKVSKERVEKIASTDSLCDSSAGKDESCTTCLQFALTWSLLLNNIAQAIPSPFKSVKKCFQKQGNDSYMIDSRLPRTSTPCKRKQQRTDGYSVKCQDNVGNKEGEAFSFEFLLGLVFDHWLQNLHKFDQCIRDTKYDHGAPISGKEQEFVSKDCDKKGAECSQTHCLGVLTSIWKGRKADVDGLLGNLRFARMNGVPSMLGVTTVKDDCQDDSCSSGGSDPEANTPQKQAIGLLQIPLSNVERLKSTLSTVSFTELIDLVTQIGRSSKDHPDKKKLFSVQDFFRYTQSEGRRFFEELDRDGDGQVTLEDLEIAMRKRRLPKRYARDFLRRTRSHLFAKSFGWKQFLSLMEQKEPTMLRAYTTLCLSKSGTLQKSQIVASLKNAGLPANEENAVAMMRFLNADTEGSISYGHFRNFMLLLPSDRLEDDPRNLWFEAATVVAVAPPMEIPAESVLKSALAGGLACALSTSLLHPVDTMKTRVQASTLSFPELIAKLPQIGIQGLYRGSIPAILGQFSSHGLRTGIFEASKLVLANVAPNVPEIQVQSLASFCSTILGTAVRIPCEVLKQRLQAGIFDNMGEAIIGTLHQDGFKGFFRGTGATLCREVPFYVAGMGLYAEAKKATQQVLRRELEPWETIVVGALSGGIAAVVTTPFDVMKTRMMTAPQGVPVTMTAIAFTILRNEGPLGLFKGAVPRFFWIAPLGAMNFAGYELARKAMDKSECPPDDLSRQKSLAKPR
ncbi:hypothetical protein AMTRI_Chr08g206140 [Amborella trichopoda]|uniref:uncharacterized protein LOC18433130 isoform X1 n=1 Tax=Amborella trichopoda TaxID=13333 RepID=UPI0005D305AC|nr:uncharacterized protein LOC18433130 isoform X1 [Amborella trichopoda]|eukprot:XP_011622937.1 uncharacterized protein LOC18433130 isoform X1 [Amborella trichopoda]